MLKKIKNKIMQMQHAAGIYFTVCLLFFFLLAGNSGASEFNYPISPGFNVIGVTKSLHDQYNSAFTLLEEAELQGITAIESYDYVAGTMLRAEKNGAVLSGDDFPLFENSGLFVYSDAGMSYVRSQPECSALHIRPGFNLAGFFCLPSGYTAYELINSLGIDKVISISAFDNVSQKWRTAGVADNAVVGEDFLIMPGAGYIIYSSAEIQNWLTPQQKFNFSPNTLTAHQGDADVNLNLTIPYPAPSGGIIVDLSSSNTSVVTVSPTVTVPEGATSVAVPITALNTGSTVNEIVDITASRPEWTDGKATITVRPKPTVNLTPATTVTGLGWTYYLTVSLTEAAPPGGLVVTLTPAPTGIVTCPSSVTIPEGASSLQVTVNAVGLGNAVITPSASGALTGTVNAVTVKPIQTIGIGPTLSKPLGVMVSQAQAPAPTSTFSNIGSVRVGVAVGSVITGLLPGRAAIGTTDMTLRINGVGLSAVAGISFIPADGITLLGNPLFIAPDGSYVEAHISVASNAPISQRTVVVSTPGGIINPASPCANIFNVTYPQPEILSISPIRKQAGSTFTLTVNGRNLNSATSIGFEPSTGILVNNPPSVNSDGTSATATVVIAADAPVGSSVVSITTPGGTSTATPSATNTFTVTPDAGVSYTPIISQQVGVSVQEPVSVSQSSTYSPVVSLPIGVAVGPTITFVSPVSGIIGASNLAVRVNGTGLGLATGISFVPDNGITIQPSSVTAAGDGSYVQAVIDIDQAAPLTARTVVFGGVSALPAWPGANQFRVTLPVPEIYSIEPITQMAGSAFTLTVRGKNLTSASSIAFLPSTGILVNNPPSVSSDGTTATVTVIIAANAPLGQKVLTITTPGGTTGSAASAANTFSVTPDIGTNYTPVISEAVGVMITVPESNVTPVTYGPTHSLPVGVNVTLPAPPATQDVNYGPLVSKAIGIAVGSTVTGISPNTIEPGATTVITINGVGLGQVNAVQAQPASGLSIGAPIPSADGLSATVSITTDANITAGKKTLIVSTASGVINPAGPATTILLVGPKPVINSIIPIQQVAGTTFTLTILGVNLKDAAEVRFVPSDGIQVNNPPTYYTDAQGEYATVTVIIDSTATGGERAVIIATPYGNTSSAATAANTFTVVQPLGLNLPEQEEVNGLYEESAEAPAIPRGLQLDPSKEALTSVITGIGSGKRPEIKANAGDIENKLPCIKEYAGDEYFGREINKSVLFSGRRGPPDRIYHFVG